MSFHLPTASPEVCKLQSAFLCRRDWTMIRGFARSRFLHHLQESSVHRSARDWGTEDCSCMLLMKEASVQCGHLSPADCCQERSDHQTTSFLLRFLTPWIGLCIVLCPFTIIQIVTKLWRKGEELMGLHCTTAAVPVTGAVHLGTPAPLHRLQWRFCGTNIWFR